MTWTRTPFGNLEKMYGSLPVAGRVVLDVGADYGTTADYFLSKGAAGVLVSERNPEWRDALHAKAASDPRIEVLPPFEAETAQSILARRPDVVKMDCERCERFVGNAPDPLVAHPEAWVIETHTEELETIMQARFQGLGYAVMPVEDFGGGPIRVWKAVR